MEQEMNGQEVLFVHQNDGRGVQAVSGIDKYGRIKTVAPTAANEADFLRVDKHSNALENFFTNFLRQANSPSHFGFFKVSLADVEQSAKTIDDQYAGSMDIDGEIFTRDAQVTPEQYAKSQSYTPLDSAKIDWAQFEALGLKREAVEKSGALDEMLNYRKSPTLMDISAKIGDTQIRTQGRLSLREQEDGRIVPVIHAVRREPQLDRPIYGVPLTPDDKEKLRTTGNLGRVIDIINTKTGEVSPSYVSIDRLTNEVVTMRADRVRIPTEIKGVVLSNEQREALKSGEQLYLEGMTSKSGKSFDAYVQVNADKRSVEFRFGETPKQRQSQEFTIPTKLGGKDLSPEDRQTLKDGGTIYLEGLKDRHGKEYNAYVKVNETEQKLNFYKWNPDKAQSQEQGKKEAQRQEPSEQKQEQQRSQRKMKM